MTEENVSQSDEFGCRLEIGKNHVFGQIFSRRDASSLFHMLEEEPFELMVVYFGWPKWNL